MTADQAIRAANEIGKPFNCFVSYKGGKFIFYRRVFGRGPVWIGQTREAAKVCDKIRDLVEVR